MKNTEPVPPPGLGLSQTACSYVKQMVNVVPLVGSCRGFVLVPLGSAGPLLCRGKQPCSHVSSSAPTTTGWSSPRPRPPPARPGAHHSRLVVVLPYSSTFPPCQRSLVPRVKPRRAPVGQGCGQNASVPQQGQGGSFPPGPDRGGDQSSPLGSFPGRRAPNSVSKSQFLSG